MPRQFRMVFDLSGTERPTRVDGAVKVEQPALIDGDVRIEVDGRTEFHVRLRAADRGELEATLDEFDATLRRLKFDPPFVGMGEGD